MSGNVHQSDKDKLKATVTQAAKDRTVTGSVTANAGTNLNTSGLAITNPETDDGTIPAGEVRETAVGLLYGHESDEGAWYPLEVKRPEYDNALFVWIRGQQGTFTVTQAAKDRTITGTATVTPSGDMARKAYYDRNSSLINMWWGLTNVATHSTTTRWTYTVPNNKKAIHSVLSGSIYQTVVDEELAPESGALVIWQTQKSGGGLYELTRSWLLYGEGYLKAIALTVVFPMNEGDMVRVQTKNFDSVVHGYALPTLLSEFDE